MRHIIHLDGLTYNQISFLSSSKFVYKYFFRTFWLKLVRVSVVKYCKSDSPSNILCLVEWKFWLSISKSQILLPNFYAWLSKNLVIRFSKFDSPSKLICLVEWEFKPSSSSSWILTSNSYGWLRENFNHQTFCNLKFSYKHLHLVE